MLLKQATLLFLSADWVLIKCTQLGVVLGDLICNIMMASDYFSRPVPCPCWTCIGLTRGEESDEERFVPAGVVDKIIFSRNYSAD